MADIPQWIFDECVKRGYFKRIGAGYYEWKKSLNLAWMIHKLILADRKRRSANAGVQAPSETR